MKIQPSEAWGLDFLEVQCIADLSNGNKQDLSLMLNFERRKNGATNEFLRIKTGVKNGN